jgi:hypothetical protein
LITITYMRALQLAHCLTTRRGLPATVLYSDSPSGRSANVSVTLGMTCAVTADEVAAEVGPAIATYAWIACGGGSICIVEASFGLHFQAQQAYHAVI